jgi:phosphatidate cytidylyltransferase
VGELTKRVAAGLVLGPAVFLLFYFLTPRLFFFFMAIVAAAATREIMVMAQLRRRWFFLGLAMLPFITLYFRSIDGFLGMMVFSALLAVTGMLVSEGEEDGSVNHTMLLAVSSILLSQLFVVVPLSCLYLLKDMAQPWPTVLLLSIWASDTVAYGFGKTFGKRPLVPRISPKKTYEGLLGAVLGSSAVVALTKGLTGLGIWEALGLGAILGMLGQIGDIFESASKRAFGVKDSSSLIPGHGGILDRIDSFVFSAPFIYFYCVLSTPRP